MTIGHYRLVASDCREEGDQTHWSLVASVGAEALTIPVRLRGPAGDPSARELLDEIISTVRQTLPEFFGSASHGALPHGDMPSPDALVPQSA